MRILTVMTAAFMLLSGNFDSSVLADDTITEIRPGLILLAGDGKLLEYYQKQLDEAPGQEARKKLLADFTAEKVESSIYFAGIVDLRLMAEKPDSAETSSDDILPDGPRLTIRSSPTGRLSFDFTLKAGRPTDSRAYADSRTSIKATVQVDERVIEADDWQEVRNSLEAGGPVGLYPPWYFPNDAPVETDEGFVPVLTGGREMTVAAVLKSGEPVVMKFDLAGLEEALEVLRQRRAEVNRTAEREMQELKKRLEALP